MRENEKKAGIQRGSGSARCRRVPMRKLGFSKWKLLQKKKAGDAAKPHTSYTHEHEQRLPGAESSTSNPDVACCVLSIIPKSDPKLPIVGCGFEAQC